MAEEASLEFRLRKIDGTRNSILEKNNNKKTKKKQWFKGAL